MDGNDVESGRWIFDEVGDSALASHWREFSMDDVVLVGMVLLHLFWLKGCSSNPTLIFALSFAVSTDCASNVGSRESGWG